MSALQAKQFFFVKAEDTCIWKTDHMTKITLNSLGASDAYMRR